MFSIVIPSWNNLPCLRLCVESLRRNSRHAHQVLVHVNDGPAERAEDSVREGRFGRLPVGAGAFPLAEFSVALGSYSGPLSSEVLSDAIRMRPVAEGARILLAAIERNWPT